MQCHSDGDGVAGDKERLNIQTLHENSGQIDPSFVSLSLISQEKQTENPQIPSSLPSLTLAMDVPHKNVPPSTLPPTFDQKNTVPSLRGDGTSTFFFHDPSQGKSHLGIFLKN